MQVMYPMSSSRCRSYGSFDGVTGDADAWTLMVSLTPPGRGLQTAPAFYDTRRAEAALSPVRRVPVCVVRIARPRLASSHPEDWWRPGGIMSAKICML